MRIVDVVGGKAHRGGDIGAFGHFHPPAAHQVEEGQKVRPALTIGDF